MTTQKEQFTYDFNRFIPITEESIVEAVLSLGPESQQKISRFIHCAHEAKRLVQEWCEKHDIHPKELTDKETLTLHRQIVGSKLAESRHANGRSQRQVGFDAAYINRIEKGIVPASIPAIDLYVNTDPTLTEQARNVRKGALRILNGFAPEQCNIDEARIIAAIAVLSERKR
jgi:hypothetical protein